MIDWNHAHNLLNIANLARQWPNLKWLHDAAMEELGRGQPSAEPKTTPVEVLDAPPAEDANIEDEVKRRRVDE